MNLSIWGGINPRITDYIYIFVFPASYYTFFWDLLILLPIMTFYPLFQFLRKKFKPEPIESNKLIWKTMVISFILGIFTPFLTSFVIILLSIKEFKIWNIVKPSEEQEKTSFKYKFQKATVRFLWYFAFFIPLGTGLFMILIGYPFYGWGLNVGFIFGVVLLCFPPTRSKFIQLNLFSIKSEYAKRIKIAFFLILIGFSFIFCYSGVFKPHLNGSQTQPGEGISSFRIITYNIRNGLAIETDSADNWNNRKVNFVTYLDSLHPDIFGLQEAHYFQLTYIQSNLKNVKYEYTGLGRDDGVHGGEHNAIFFRSDRFRFLDGDTFWLSNLPQIRSKTWGNTINRICTWVRLEEITTKKQFCVVCTHYDGAINFQMNASFLILERIQQYSGGLPVLLMGDFNMDNTSAGYIYLTTQTVKPLRDSLKVYHNNSIPFDYSSSKFRITDPPTRRIDFIFITQEIGVTNCFIPKDSYNGGHTYSDHFPVVLDCEL